MEALQQFRKELKALGDPAKAAILQRFFKTGPGQYGEGDVFLGVTVPQNRQLVQKYQDLSLPDLLSLLKSEIHEERLASLLILVRQYRRGDEAKRRETYQFYIDNSNRINNWDLVDSSAEHIVGPYLKNRSKAPLLRLARSKNLWERRIAMLSTFHYIKEGEPEWALKIAQILLNDPEDLLHKAVGWMLREIGKRCSEASVRPFLDRHCAVMPRTMLRYAIERLPEPARQKYLKTRVNKKP